MGILEYDGESLNWNEIKLYAKYVKKHGIVQFLNNYQRLLERPVDILKWGDEVEYMVIRFDHKNRKVQLSLRGDAICNILQEKENSGIVNLPSSWRHEYASHMLEGTPGVPYQGDMAQFKYVESNMEMRRKEIQELLQPNEQIMTLTAFPRLGCFNYTNPSYKADSAKSNQICQSLFIPNEAIGSHPRFLCLERSIRERRGERVSINIPIFKDTSTPSPFIEKFNDPEANQAAKPDHIYMDSTSFGFGNCCLQITIQGSNMDETKLLYDQLAPVCPIVMALSAAAPIWRGYLADVDVRWPVIEQGVDDRTREERGLEPLVNNERVIRRPRFGSINSYLHKESRKFNDVAIEIDLETKYTLLDAGVDQLLAQHIAHLWMRDPLTLFTNNIEVDDKKVTDHFENIQTTNWHSLRFKPPPPGSDIGWRVEFRVCEVQLTDFENAAFSVFVVLLTRVILTYNLDFCIPLSYVHTNMTKAQKNNAINLEKFYFRSNIVSCCCRNSDCKNHIISDDESLTEEHFQKMSINTIINGKKDVFPGFILLIQKYLGSVDVDIDTRLKINEYLDFISNRASGDYMTAAQWMRHFVTSHPEYKQDSVVSDSIAYDLLVRCDQIQKSKVKCYQLFKTAA
ncbi:unnamed protein product [Clavelina lepadiformis]|uniref:Glutamate--cysteine ligase n=1 Tax=Clavelina lepadiformis TaxID=159417 RepID=A0ABP0H047_CLALP